jgi:Uma2 family endonuclease
MTTAITVEPVTLRPPGVLECNEGRYEIIDGQRVELPPMSLLASILTSDLVPAINYFGQEHQLGQAVAETLFQLPPPVNRTRRPDVAFVSFKRWPVGKVVAAKANAWEVVPDLAIEVISPSDLMEEVLEKIEEYFRSGVLQVWVVYPLRRMVHGYESMQTIHGLTAADDLLSGSILPDFRLPLKSLFE